jgi:hypothetical protein
MTVHFLGTAYSAVEAGQPHVHAARNEVARAYHSEDRQHVTQVTIVPCSSHNTRFTKRETESAPYTRGDTIAVRQLEAKLAQFSLGRWFQ